jgi:hypothetical protein
VRQRDLDPLPQAFLKRQWNDEPMQALDHVHGGISIAAIYLCNAMDMV